MTRDNGLIRKLAALGLPPDDFAIFGSAPLMIRGLRESRDLDAVARGAAWAKAVSPAERLEKPAGGGTKAVLAGGDIEFFDVWGPGEWDIDDLIDTADVIDGVRFVSLDRVAKWKSLMGRPKDLADLELIERYRRGGGQ